MVRISHVRRIGASPDRTPEIRMVYHKTPYILRDNPLDRKIQRQGTVEMKSDLQIALEGLLEEIVVPKKNCECHITPPCFDCVENEALREAVEHARKVLKKYE